MNTKLLECCNPELEINFLEANSQQGQRERESELFLSFSQASLHGYFVHYVSMCTTESYGLELFLWAERKLGQEVISKTVAYTFFCWWLLEASVLGSLRIE